MFQATKDKSVIFSISPSIYQAAILCPWTVLLLLLVPAAHRVNEPGSRWCWVCIDTPILFVESK
jgi:hypothetical protein